MNEMNALNTKIVLDSSADMPREKSIPLACVPLKIITSEKEYVDNESLDVSGMIADLRSYSGKSSTSCPNPQEFLSAFGEAEYVFCITITGSLSGSNNAANIAAREYESLHEGRRVHVIDSLSTGPELVLIARKIEEEILAGKSFAQAAKSAANAASSAATLASKWGNATASANTLSPGSDATVSVTENAQGNKHITYGIPRGEKGEKGDTGPAGVTFRLDGATLYIDTV